MSKPEYDARIPNHIEIVRENYYSETVITELRKMLNYTGSMFVPKLTSTVVLPDSAVFSKIGHGELRWVVAIPDHTTFIIPEIKADKCSKPPLWVSTKWKITLGMDGSVSAVAYATQGYESELSDYFNFNVGVLPERILRFGPKHFFEKLQEQVTQYRSACGDKNVFVHDYNIKFGFVSEVMKWREELMTDFLRETD